MHFTPLPQTKSRRRIYLMRHGEVSYTDDEGNPVEDTVSVRLTQNGIRQAKLVAENLARIKFDRVVCSGFPRTLQTAQIVSNLPDGKIEIKPDLQEIKEGNVNAVPVQNRLRDIVYYLESASLPENRFAGGDRFDKFSERVIDGFNEIARSPDWTNLLLVTHGVVNRVVLSYLVTGSRDGALACLARFEQDPCCLNVVDLDYNDGDVSRSYLRLINMTPYDPVKESTTLISGEVSYLDWLGPFN